MQPLQQLQNNLIQYYKWSFFLYSIFLLNTVSANTPTPIPGLSSSPSSVDIYTNSPSIPGVRDVVDYASWLSRQQLSVWFAIITILFGVVIYLIIRHLLRSLDLQRKAHSEDVKIIREENLKLQIEEKALSLQLLQYLEKDHSQTIVLVKDNQSIMQENISLLRSIQQDRHDEKILRQQNHEILKRLDPESKKQYENAKQNS